MVQSLWEKPEEYKKLSLSKAIMVMAAPIIAKDGGGGGVLSHSVNDWQKS